MNKTFILFSIFVFGFQLASAQEGVTHEFKNGELIIYSTKKPVPKKAIVPGNEDRNFTIPIDARIDATISNDLIWDDYSTEDVSLYVEKDYIQNNQILIPKGSVFSGSAHERSNRRVDFQISRLELPDGKKYHITAEGRNPNGRDFVQAQYIHQSGGGKKIAGKAFGAATRGIFDRAIGGGTVAEDVAIGAGNAAADEGEDVIQSDKKKSYLKLTKNTKVKIIFLKSL